ncbi:MAG: sigma-70 family RNA polymerase sigma factor [Phycisphaerae bacterium]|nr:sigma-70 family RNA polymerase sigma factor [Phycisphaerae bacterium]
MEKDILADMISKCQKGDKDAFNWLLNEYGPRLYRYFLRTSGNDERAGDMLQEMFVKLLQKIKKYQHQGQFEHWLFRVAANLARDNARKQKNVYSLQNDDPDKPGPGDLLVGRGPGPFENVEHSEQVEILQQAIDMLTADQKEIILLRHYSQMSFQEIAQELKIPVGTALARAHRGLKRLKEILDPKINAITKNR